MDWQIPTDGSTCLYATNLDLIKILNGLDVAKIHIKEI
jgi:hypothetical protein